MIIRHVRALLIGVTIAFCFSGAALAQDDGLASQAAQAFRNGDYSGAATLFQQLVASDPQNALGWYFLGQSLQQTGDQAGARKAYRKVLEIQPNGEVADKARPLFTAMTDSTTEWQACDQPSFTTDVAPSAIEGCSNIIALGNTQTAQQLSIAYGRRATFYLATSDFANAISDYGNAIELNPAAVAFHYWRAIAYERQGNWEGAMPDINEWIRLLPPNNPQDSAIAFANRGNIYEHDGDLRSAVSDYNTAITLDSQNTQAAEGLRRLQK